MPATDQPDDRVYVLVETSSGRWYPAWEAVDALVNEAALQWVVKYDGSLDSLVGSVTAAWHRNRRMLGMDEVAS